MNILFFFGGGILKHDFVLKHVKLIFLVVLLLLVFIGNRYTCMRKLRDIDRLQQELRDIRFEALSTSSSLTGSSRQSQIETKVKELDLPIQAPASPPYELIP
ncbi:MAG: hypothetical protein LBT73_00495 [Tannerellaceae bacterium]|jgi:hypothetical protein|nr:hypothetical protein [Tannerellaceae bacterium]